MKAAMMITLSLFLTAVALAETETLKYDDNKPDGKKSIAGAGEMIMFTMPEGGTAVRAVRIHGVRYGEKKPPKEDFLIYFLNEDMTEIIHTEKVPYSKFKDRKKMKWVRIGLKKPVEMPKTFWVVLAFDAKQTKGVYVSYDTSTGGKHSKVGLPNKPAADVDFKGDWMIRVDVEKK
jgi:hypothetical protein